MVGGEDHPMIFTHFQATARIFLHSYVLRHNYLLFGKNYQLISYKIKVNYRNNYQITAVIIEDYFIFVK